MTKFRIVHRPWLGRPYVVEHATAIGVVVAEEGEKPQFSPFLGLAAFTKETEAREFVQHCMDEKVIAEFTVG